MYFGVIVIWIKDWRIRKSFLNNFGGCVLSCIDIICRNFVGLFFGVEGVLLWKSIGESGIVCGLID